MSRCAYCGCDIEWFHGAAWHGWKATEQRLKMGGWMTFCPGRKANMEHDPTAPKSLRRKESRSDQNAV
jgi:hypothetical protein